MRSNYRQGGFLRCRVVLRDYVLPALRAHLQNPAKTPRSHRSGRPCCLLRYFEQLRLIGVLWWRHGLGVAVGSARGAVATGPVASGAGTTVPPDEGMERPDIGTSDGRPLVHGLFPST